MYSMIITVDNTEKKKNCVRNVWNICESRNMCELLKLLISDMISDSDFDTSNKKGKRWSRQSLLELKGW